MWNAMRGPEVEHGGGSMPAYYRTTGGLARRTVSRRRVIGLAGGLAFLAACGSDNNKGGSSPAPNSGVVNNTATPVSAGAAPVSNNIKRGGTLRLGTWRAWPGVDPDYS